MRPSLDGSEGFRTLATKEDNMMVVVKSPERLAALEATGLMDSPAEETFDRLTRLTSRVVAVPVALVSLVDGNRQFFKSSCGLGEPWCSRRETPLTHSFCQHVVEAGAPLIVKDARIHPVVKDNLAIPDLGVIAYAGFPLRGPEGHVLGSFCAIDVVPRTWTEEELANLKDLTESAASEISLRSEVDARRRAEGLLTLARDEAIRSSQTKSTFLASMSHELRTPLNSIIGFSEVLSDDPSVTEKDRNKRYVGNVLSSAHHLLGLIDELLDLSRIEAGKVELSLEPVDFAALLKKVVRELAVEAEKKSLDLVIDDTSAEITVTADPVRLRQVLLNIIGNAVKFTQAGEIRIKIRAAKNPVLTVTDTGHGLKASDLERIFLPFERVSNTVPGTGLGLGISRHLVTLMGGTLEAESEGLGQGSTFRLTLAKAD